MKKSIFIKRFLFVLLVVVMANEAHSQTLQDYLDKGDRFFSKRDYQHAFEQYKLAYDLTPEDPHANFRVGLTYLYLTQKSKALPYLQKAHDTHPEVDADINYHLGMAYQHNYMYDKAREQFEQFKKKNRRLADIAEHKLYECRMADSISKKPIPVLIENVGNAVNTVFHDYSPIISPDGSKLIFTTNRPSEGDNPDRGSTENFEDIYVARKVNGYWVAPQKIGTNVNIKFHDAAASISADGNTLYLYYEQGSGDIFISTFDGTDWSKPVPLNKNINTPFWETSASVSADGQSLYFTSSRPGGEGELDIYVSHKDHTGDWGKPVSLGKTINTPGSEDSPFIHPDGVTLYFSSNGHPTMGSNDIFVSEFKHGAWQKPKNLGFPVNSLEYDGFFSMSADKKTGYYSTSREDGYGDTDIYTVTFLELPQEEEDLAILASSNLDIIEEPELAEESGNPVEEKPVIVEEKPVVEEKPPVEEKVETKDENFVDPIIQLHKDMKVVTVLKGKVVDANSGESLAAVITLVNNENRQVITRIKSNDAGDFELIIPHGGNYGVATEKIGYLFNSINFDLPQFAEYQEIDTHIIMVKAEVGSKAVLKNIFFDTGEWALKAESTHELNNIYELLLTHPNVRVQINGHTDNVGEEDFNKALSLKRATSVVNFLIEKGIDASRLSAVGYGEEQPLVSNDDEEGGRKINRRTEVEIVGVD